MYIVHSSSLSNFSSGFYFQVRRIQKGEKYTAQAHHDCEHNLFSSRVERSRFYIEQDNFIDSWNNHWSIFLRRRTCFHSSSRRLECRPMIHYCEKSQLESSSSYPSKEFGKTLREIEILWSRDEKDQRSEQVVVWKSQLTGRKETAPTYQLRRGENEEMKGKRDRSMGARVLEMRKPQILTVSLFTVFGLTVGEKLWYH